MRRWLTIWNWSWAQLVMVVLAAVCARGLFVPRDRWTSFPIFVFCVGYLLCTRVVYFNGEKAHLWVWRGPLPALVHRIPRERFKCIGLVERFHKASFSERGGIATAVIDAIRGRGTDEGAPPGNWICDVVLESEPVDEKVERLLLKSFTGYERARKFADTLTPVMGLPVRDHTREPERTKNARP